VNDLPSTWDSTEFSAAEALTLNSVAGQASVSGGATQIVYAYRGQTGLATGPNTFILENPDGDSVGAKTFSGSLLYRVVDTTASSVSAVDKYNGGAGLVDATSSLTIGQTVTVSGVLMPGDSVLVPVGEDFAQTGTAIQGLKYTVTVQPASYMFQDYPWESQLVVPTGYVATSGLEVSYDSNGQPKPNLLTSDGQGLFYNYTNSAAWTDASGTTTVSGSSISREWKYPIDFTGGASGAARGAISLTVPALTSSSTVMSWTAQTTPFVTMSITLNSVTEYPLLSELNALTLRNYDIDSAQHNDGSPIGQQPFQIYRVSTQEFGLVLGSVTLGAVSNLNKPAGTSSETEVPLACHPRIEYQTIGTADSPSANGWAPTVGSNWFGMSMANSLPIFSNDADALVAANTLSDTAYATQQAVFTDTDFYNAVDNKVPMAGSALSASSTGRPGWLLVRISATKRDLVGDPGRARSTCGSNNVRISTAKFTTISSFDQCRSYTDCAVDRASNPNKAQEKDSANADAGRFSTCLLTARVGVNYLNLPSSKCVECTSDNHCKGGQYCHLDAGICNSASGNAKYYCDAESAKFLGMCREKSADVLGKTCRTSFTPNGNGFATTPVLAAAGGTFPTVATVSSGTAAGQPTAPVSSGIAMQGDAKNDKMAKGGFGVCGEYRYGVGSDPSPLATSSESNIRFALWTGYCDQDRVCVECVPGSTDLSGKVCLNGKTFSSMDVDGTVRTFAQNTAAGGILGTTSMIILLVCMWASYMFTEARRARHQMGMPAMTCIECLFCCCGTWSEKYGADGAVKDTRNPLA